jgi:hypothetical protein
MFVKYGLKKFFKSMIFSEGRVWQTRFADFPTVFLFFFLVFAKHSSFFN